MKLGGSFMTSTKSQRGSDYTCREPPSTLTQREMFNEVQMDFLTKRLENDPKNQKENISELKKNNLLLYMFILRVCKNST